MENLVYLGAMAFYVLGVIANGAAAFENDKDEKQILRQHATNLLLMAIALVLASIYLKG